jgi:putative tricarboxylic transport membrane protein
VRAQPTAKWPPRHVWPALVTGLIAFILYAYLLEPLGFMLATTLFFIVFGHLFAAKLWQGAVAGIGFSVVLYMVFVWGLHLYLPVGNIFERLP